MIVPVPTTPDELSAARVGAGGQTQSGGLIDALMERIEGLERLLMTARGEIVAMRAERGLIGKDGLMTFQRVRALEDAADAARTHLLGGPVSRQDALDKCDIARRTA